MPQFDGIFFVSETSEPQSFIIQGNFRNVEVRNTVFKAGIEVIFDIDEDIIVKNCCFNNNVIISSSMSNCSFDDNTLTIRSNQRRTFRFFGIEIYAQRYAIEIGDDSEVIFRNCLNYSFRVIADHLSAITLLQNSKLIVTSSRQINCEMNSSEMSAIKLFSNTQFKLNLSGERKVFNFGFRIGKLDNEEIMIDSVDDEGYCRHKDLALGLARLETVAEMLGY